MWATDPVKAGGIVDVDCRGGKGKQVAAPITSVLIFPLTKDIGGTRLSVYGSHMDSHPQRR